MALGSPWLAQLICCKEGSGFPTNGKAFQDNTVSIPVWGWLELNRKLVNGYNVGCNVSNRRKFNFTCHWLTGSQQQPACNSQVRKQTSPCRKWCKPSGTDVLSHTRISCWTGKNIIGMWGNRGYIQSELNLTWSFFFTFVFIVHWYQNTSGKRTLRANPLTGNGYCVTQLLRMGVLSGSP